jgi:pterin-4a-carbinolamine dehydratase
MKDRPLWQLSDDRRRISRHFIAKNFAAALKFVNQAGEVAEENSRKCWKIIFFQFFIVIIIID